jgi:hypothetical protein
MVWKFYFHLSLELELLSNKNGSTGKMILKKIVHFFGFLVCIKMEILVGFFVCIIKVV